MIDFWGRPLSKAEKQSGETRALDSINDVKKIIEDEIAETLNLASVDPNEIVVFQDKQGKLKSSNVSIDDLLIRRRDAADNSVAVFEHGKLKPGVLFSTITDTLANYDKEFDDHVKNYNNFRKNVIHKFFGTPITAIPSLAEIKTLIDDQKTKFDQITLLGRQLEAVNKDVTTIKDDQKTKFDEIKTSIDDQKTKFTDSQKDHAGVISDIGQQLLNINLNVFHDLKK